MITQDFITAGNAIFTVEPAVADRERLGLAPHWTYRVRHKEATDSQREAWFVSLLTGPSNEHDYSYVGMLDAQTGAVRLTKASRLTDDAWPVKVLRRVLARLWAGEGDAIEASGWKVHHEGRCGKCGRLLTTPESCERGIGPDCWERMNGGGYAEETEEFRGRHDAAMIA